MQVIIDVKMASLPPHTREEFEEWVKFQVGYQGGMSMENPLVDYDLEANYCDFR